MDEIKRSHIEAACRRLSVSFSVLVDRNDAEGVAALFLPNGRFSRPDMVLGSAREIRETLQGRTAKRVTRHVCANILIDVKDDTHASGVTYFTLFVGERTGTDDHAPLTMELPLVVGEYHDLYQRTDDGWRFAERKSIAVFRRP